MSQNTRTMLALASLVLAILACNMPFEQLPPSGEIQTAAALTVQAVISPPPRSVTRTASPSPAPHTPSRTPTRTPSPNETTTTTPTYTVPIASVRASTNCRTGPGEEYEIVVTYLAGKELEIAGRYDPGNFWLVKSSESPAGTCWLWGEFVEVTGSYWAVPSVTPPPTATLAPPQTPSIQRWEYFCSGGQMSITVEWTDRATNESGYRILRDGESVAELAANSTTYSETIELASGESAEYYLQVYGPGGTATASIGKLTC